MLEEHLDEGKWAHVTFRAIFLVLVVKSVLLFLRCKQLPKTVVVRKWNFTF